MTSLEELKQNLIAEIEKQVSDKILENENAVLLTKLIKNADSEIEARNIAMLGTTYKRTGFNFNKKLEKISDETYLVKNEELSFKTSDNAITHKLIIGDNYPALQNLLTSYKNKIKVTAIYFFSCGTSFCNRPCVLRRLARLIPCFSPGLRYFTAGRVHLHFMRSFCHPQAIFFQVNIKVQGFCKICVKIKSS